MVLKRVSGTMMNGQAAFISAVHRHVPSHSAYGQHQFAFGDIGRATANGGLTSHHLPHFQPTHAGSANSNLALAPAQGPLFAGQAGAASTPAGPFHPVPLPFRPAAVTLPAADLPANYNTACQAVARHHQFVPSAIPPPQRMAAYSGQQQHQDEDLAHFQELSNKWEPEATGPLVSELLDSSAITTEYADADPVYQVKTASLPQSFAHYRTCRGDGHCGWRAVAFCYFEALVRTAEPHKFHEEVARLKSLQNILDEAGFDSDIIESFAESAWDLLAELANMTIGDGMFTVQQTFNDEGISLAIIHYFKFLTSAWMQKYPAIYEPYLLEPLMSYVKNNLEPSAAQMEEAGLAAMCGVLASPAGFSAEVHYLDRSAGDSINIIQYASGGERPIATIRLLYRPGHYDILYKAQDLETTKGNSVQPARTQPQNVFVALQHGSTEHYHHSTGGFRPDTIEIPGMSFWNGPQAWPQSIGTYEMSPASMSPAIAPSRSAIPAGYQNVANAAVHDLYFQNTPMPQNSMSTMSLPHHPSIDRGSFRPSAWEYTLEMNPGPHQSLCQTAIFRNSHYNTAHYNNPDFEPEQWHPENEYGPTDRPRKKSSHSS